MPRKTIKKPAKKTRAGKTATAVARNVGAQAKANTKAVSGASAPMAPSAIEEVFRRFQAREPAPQGELAHDNPFTLLVAVVLSAQATDAGVNRATPALFAAADTPEKMVALGEAKVRDYVKTIGLYRTKAKNVVALSRRLIEIHGGQVPREREALEALPGVGRKTANVVLNIAFGEPTIAVDTHVFRVGNRTGLAGGKTPLEVETKLGKVIPAKYRAARPSLADPARPLHLQGAAPALRAMPDRGFVQVAGKEDRRLNIIGAPRSTPSAATVFYACAPSAPCRRAASPD